MSEIRDAVYGFIEPTEEEWRIINSPLLQRLRKIRQLACAYLVYPCALHTRFEHSLGVMYLSSIIAKKLLSSDDNKRIVRLAALLHDVGHGPFSHVSEEILELFSDSSSGEITEKIHEKITTKFIQTNKDILDLLGRVTIERVIGLLTGSKLDVTLMKQIVSGPIDADKQDYLLRDSYFCGVKYGVYDYERLINTLESYKDEVDEYIAVNEDGLHALEQFILAKYYMTRQVYRHKIRLITDQMIIRGIELGIIKDEHNILKKLYIFEDSETYLDNYLQWWDDRLFNFLVFELSKGYAHEIFQRIYERRIFKQIFSKKIEDIPGLDGRIRSKLQKITKIENKEIRNKLEEDISHILGVKPEFTIINSYQVKSVKEMARDNEPEGKISIIKNGGGREEFETASTVFRSIDDSLNEVWLEVYAPVEFRDKRDKNDKIGSWEKDIIVCLKEFSI